VRPAAGWDTKYDSRSCVRDACTDLLSRGVRRPALGMLAAGAGLRVAQESRNDSLHPVCIYRYLYKYLYKL
jgi:hypothetical protein